MMKVLLGLVSYPSLSRMCRINVAKPICVPSRESTCPPPRGSSCRLRVVPTAVNTPVVAIQAAPVVYSSPPPRPHVASLFKIKINPRVTGMNVVKFRFQGREFRRKSFIDNSCYHPRIRGLMIYFSRSSKYRTLQGL